MKLFETRNGVRATFLAGTAALVISAAAVAGSNVCTDHKFVWGENIGWINMRDANSASQGVRVNPNHLSGFAWGENVGWINFGAGCGPYANIDNTNFGVNIDPGTGEMSGFAWGENIGWINFATTSAIGADGARFDAAARRFRDYAWGENVGWINLDDVTHFSAAVIGDADGNGAVNVNDISFVVFRLGQLCANDADVDGSGAVNVNDISFVVFRLGSMCPP